jgi:nicotinamidase-related amidase
MIHLNPLTTALVLIDLQKGIVGFPLAPYTGPEVVNVGIELAKRFRKSGSPVILVNVAFSPDLGDVLHQPVDRPWPIPPGGFPAGFSDLVDGLAEPADLRVTKRQWGAFHGTDLDLQLRRRGIRTIVLGGITTNMGVESTARQAYELGYELVIAEDGVSGLSAEMHSFSVGEILPLLARVTPSSGVELRQS